MPRQTKPKAKVTANEKIIANLVGMKMTAKQPEMVAWLLKLAEAYPTLRYVKVTFHGGGDSGDIDDYELEDSECASINPAIGFPLSPDKDEFLYKFLDKHVHCDWVNNDGGGGVLTFDLETGEVRVDSYYYETIETECDAVTVNLLD